MSRLTQREKEILTYLKQEPTISQDELAAKLRISRSAAAVHISNLMRKGYILGRGYIFSERSGVLVIGKTWLEICAYCAEHGTPSGRIEISFGGRGYVLASELVKFRVEPTLLTSLGRDEIGDQIYNDLAQKGVKVEHIIRSPVHFTGKRVVVCKAERLLFQVEDMNIFQSLNEKLLATKEELLRTAQVVLVDGSLPFQKIKYFLAKTREYNVLSSVVGCSLKLFWEEELFSFPQLFLVCTQKEIEGLSGSFLGSEPEALFPFCRKVVDQGLKALIVVFGEQGVILASKEETAYLPIPPLQDPRSSFSLLAGIAGGLASGYGLRLAVRRAMGTRSSGNSDKISN